MVTLTEGTNIYTEYAIFFFGLSFSSCTVDGYALVTINNFISGFFCGMGILAAENV